MVGDLFSSPYFIFASLFFIGASLILLGLLIVLNDRVRDWWAKWWYLDKTKSSAILTRFFSAPILICVGLYALFVVFSISKVISLPIGLFSTGTAAYLLFAIFVGVYCISQSKKWATAIQKYYVKEGKKREDSIDWGSRYYWWIFRVMTVFSSLVILVALFSSLFPYLSNVY